jgi:hypothetical protein
MSSPMLCAGCAERICERAGRLPGVVRAGCGESDGMLALEYDPDIVSTVEIDAQLARLVAEVGEGVEHATYRVTGLD